MDHIFSQQLPLALVLVFVQQWLKKQPWFPIVSMEQTKLNARMNHLFSIIATGAATLGVHFTWTAADHTLAISGLAWSTVMVGAWHWVQQYALTKGTYTALQGQLNPPEVVHLPFVPK
jgi:hypothetical protein